MADSTINGLSSGSTPLAGTEEVPIWQSSATVKVTVQDIADLASGSNLGNADLTSSAAARKFILNGDTSSDYLTVRNGSDTTDVLKVQGDDAVFMNKLGIGATPSASYPVSFTSTTAAGNMYVVNTAASSTCAYLLSTGASSRTLRLQNNGTTAPDALEITMSGNTGSGAKKGLDLDITGTAINNVGLDLNVSGATNNLAINIEAGDIKLDTTTGSKIGTATSQKIGFWNATPVVQPTTGIAAGTFTANTSGISDDSATFDGYTIGQIAAALRQVGILA